VAAGPTTISTDKPATVAESDYQTLPSGVKYAVLKEGSGPEAEHNEVFVHYTGWLESNKEKFDSSVERGEPLPFTLGHGGVIPGWQEGIKGMKVGEQRQLVIPPDMAYGAEGTPGGPIPPNATLIFDVELMRMGEGHSH
jgi:peptidylprolyl isomerase